MNLQRSIIQTLAYFDIFNLPLTKEELFRYILSGYPDNPDLQMTYTEFLNQLQQLEHLQQFQHHDGFYYLSGREEIVAIRQSKVKIIEQKMKIAKRGIRKLTWVPFLRAVFVCNTVAFGSADENSDIDVLIIVKKGRIWLTRLLATLSLSLFGLRRTKNKIKNKICLSFYLADDCLNLEKIAIEDDVYLVYWLAQLVLVYDCKLSRYPDNPDFPDANDSYHSKIIRANRWVGKYLMNFSNIKYQIADSRFGRVGKFFKNILEKIWSGGYGNLLEVQAKGAQRAKMKMNLQSAQNTSGTKVVVSDSMLKFHEKDRRLEYQQAWVKRCKDCVI